MSANGSAQYGKAALVAQSVQGRLHHRTHVSIDLMDVGPVRPICDPGQLSHA